MGRKVIVTNLSKEVRRSEIKELFGQVGKIADIWVGDKEAIIVSLLEGFWRDIWTETNLGIRFFQKCTQGY